MSWYPRDLLFKGGKIEILVENWVETEASFWCTGLVIILGNKHVGNSLNWFNEDDFHLFSIDSFFPLANKWGQTAWFAEWRKKLVFDLLLWVADSSSLRLFSEVVHCVGWCSSFVQDTNNNKGVIHWKKKSRIKPDGAFIRLIGQTLRWHLCLFLWHVVATAVSLFTLSLKYVG